MKDIISRIKDGENLKSQEELTEALTQMITLHEMQSERVKSLQSQVSGHGSLIKEGVMHDTDRNPSKEKLHNFLGAWCVRNIMRQPEAPEVPKERIKEANSFYETNVKSTLGTPLVSDSTTGSYLVPVEYHDQIIRAIEDQAVVYPLCRQFNMKSQSMNIPVPNAVPSVSWVGSQGSDISETSPTFTQRELAADMLATWVSVTGSMLEDDITALGEYLSEMISAAVANELDNQILNGTGSSPAFTGLLQHASVNEVTQGTGTGDDSIAADDIFSLIESITAKKYLANSKLIMRPTTMSYLRKLTDASGRFILQYESGNPPSLAGYPILLTDQISSPGSEEAYMAFGNPKFYAVGTRVTPQFFAIDRSMYRAQNDEIILFMRSRYALICLIPAAFAILKTAAA